jgi:hypothetical protein
MRHSWIVLVFALATASCTDSKSPVAPTAVAGPTPPVLTPSLPTTVPGVLAVAMPIDPGDSANTAFGITPFGYHGADHAEDGHPGWDIEYRLGALVRAAAAGTVQSVSPDPSAPGRFTVQLEHEVTRHFYRTVYTNLATVVSDIAVNATVRSGQVIGAAGTISQTVGTTPITYAMTHFQLDDFEYYRETPHPNAVSPEPFLTANAKAVFDGLWSRAVFVHELVEPFPTNPRVLAFPASRTWTRAGGDGPAGIRFTRRDARGTAYEYSLLAESGTVIESGTVVLGITSRPYPTIDLLSPTAIRRGVYDILSNEMRLSLAVEGALRPGDLGSASVYRTTP